MKRYPRLATLLLILGSLPFTTTLWFHYVPAGMDASMHTTAASLIARAHGLPADYAPFAPEVWFPALNLGLPAVAAVAIRWGGEPAAVMLASHHLTFTCLILASYILLRWWTGRNAAALLAVVSVWLARGTQATVDWGGFPTVLSVSAGILAARLLLQHTRTRAWRLSLATGATVAALALIHGVGAGTWFYCAGIWVALAALAQSRLPLRTLGGLIWSGAWALGFLLVYRLSGHLDVGQTEMAATRVYVQMLAPREEDWTALLSAASFVRKDSGTLLVLLGLGALGMLLVQRRWVALAMMAGVFATLPVLVANARWLLLPGSFLLYPDRVLYWTGPICAVAMALAWRGWPRPWRGTTWVSAGGGALLVVSFCFHNTFYQKSVREGGFTGERWDALVWARAHLQPGEHFVHAAYQTAGSYLPGVALIACDGAHHHHFIGRQFARLDAQRAITHLLLENNQDGDQAAAGRVVFRNDTVTIIELTHPASAELLGHDLTAVHEEDAKQ